ncbi:MAG: DUF169 domain-containing protein [Armatimonadota bacterium]
MPSPIQELLGLKFPPVAVSFRPEAPAGIERVDQPACAGCSYWRLAAEGRVFYTEAPDHYGCPVGAHTHGIPLPPQQAEELAELARIMTGLEYVTEAEVQAMPSRSQPFGVAVYAPLDRATETPDLLLVRGTARQIMLLTEAAQAAGVAPERPALGRPACVLVPLTLDGSTTATSLGCIGNRVYTGLQDDELYFALPGSAIDAVTERLPRIVGANQELEKFHRARQGA